MTSFSDIGMAGTPWGEAEKKQWRSRQNRTRSYQSDVVERLKRQSNVIQYGELLYETGRYPLSQFESPIGANSFLWR